MFCFAGGFCLYRDENSESSMNVPNKLTISRFLLTFAFLAVIFAKPKFYETIALALFSVAGLTPAGHRSGKMPMPIRFER